MNHDDKYKLSVDFVNLSFEILSTGEDPHDDEPSRTIRLRFLLRIILIRRKHV